MKSSLVNFIAKYRDSKLPLTKLRTIFNKEVEKDDFDKNKEDVWLWYSNLVKK